MKVFQMAQGSDEWRAIRKARPTGSEFGRIITPAKGEPAAAADTYISELIAESLGWRKSFGGNPDTERGNRLEPSAIRWLKMREGIVSRNVGFCLSDCGRYGCSPDALTVAAGEWPENIPIEVKAPDDHTFIKWWIPRDAQGNHVLPSDHKAQMHAEIHIAKAPYGIFCAYAEHPAIDPFWIKVMRDGFTEKIGPIIDAFCTRLEKLQRELLGGEFDNYARPVWADER